MSKVERSVLRDVAKGLGGDRPLMRLNWEQALRLGDTLVDRPHQQFDFWFHTWMEFVDLRKAGKSARLVLEGRFDTLGVRPEPWFRAAWVAVRSVRGTTKGRHHLYVVLFDGFGPDGKGVGLYVGETSRRPENRFKQHASGLGEQNAARLFRHDRDGRRHRPLAVMTSFFGHMNLPKRAEAKQLEVASVQAMLGGGVPADRVGGPRALATRRSEAVRSTLGDTSQATA
jgi:hypothetical protein